MHFHFTTTKFPYFSKIPIPIHIKNSFLQFNCRFLLSGTSRHLSLPAPLPAYHASSSSSSIKSNSVHTFHDFALAAAGGGGGGRGAFLYCLKPTVTWSQLVGGGGDDDDGAAAGFGAYLRFDTEEGEHWERRCGGGGGNGAQRFQADYFANTSIVFSFGFFSLLFFSGRSLERCLALRRPGKLTIILVYDYDFPYKSVLKEKKCFFRVRLCENLCRTTTRWLTSARRERSRTWRVW